MKRWMLGMGLLALAGGAQACASGQRVTTKADQTVTLLYFADLHAQLEPHPELFWSGGKEEVAVAGGVGRIAALANRLRAERPGSVLFMDAGDTFQGSGVAAWTEGADLVPALNALKLDVAVPGNWEVIYGIPVLERRSSQLDYPMVASNVWDAKSGKRLFAPYRVFERAGLRVVVVGFTDPDVPKRQPPSYSAGARYTEAGELQPLLDAVRSKERADLVVLLTHVGLPKAVHLAETLRGVDVVLSGDTHERTERPIVRGDTWVVEPGSFGSFLGRLDLTVRQGRVADRRWELIPLRADRFPSDPGVDRIVQETLAPFRGRLDRVIGQTSAPLYRYAVAETGLDKVLADALREAAGTDLALSNGFRFGFPIPAGAVRESDLWNAYPIVTQLKTGRVTGRQLRDFWERELENVYASDPTRLFGGWLPRPSGMTLRFEAAGSPGQRIRELLVGGRPVQDDAVYTVVACEREGDAPTTLCRIPNVAEPRVLPIDAHEAVRKYLARHVPLAAPDDPRVVALDQPAVVRTQFAP